MTRAALYTRVSSEQQAEKFGLDAQRRALREYCERNTLDVVAEFSDDGYSGATIERPGLTRLREAARLKAVDVVVVPDLDRLSRQLAHQLLLVDDLEKSVRLVFLTMPDSSSPEGRMFAHIRGAVSEWERKKIADRTLRGRREAARKGRVVTRAPYGYRADPGEPTRLIVHEAEASTVRMIFAWVTEEAMAIRRVATELRRLGIAPRRGQRWSHAAVRYLLTNELYAGVATFGRYAYSPRSSAEPRRKTLRPEADWIRVAVPALIPADVFHRAQAAIARNLDVGRPAGRLYLLRGLARCSCGQRLAGTATRHLRYYRCGSRDRTRADEPCPQPPMRADRLEAAVWDTVVGILRNPALLTAKLEAHHAQVAALEVEVASEAAVLRRELADVERREGRLLDLFADTAAGASADALQGKLAALARQKVGLRERLGRADSLAAKRRSEEERHETIRAYCARALVGLERLDEARRQHLLRSLLDAVVVSGQDVELRGILPGRAPVDGNRTKPLVAVSDFQPQHFRVLVKS